jgi:hypothetical protein
MIHSSLIFCYSYHNIKIQIRKGLERRKMEIPEREKSRDKRPKIRKRSTPKAPSTYEVCWMAELNPYIHTDKKPCYARAEAYIPIVDIVYIFW